MGTDVKFHRAIDSETNEPVLINLNEIIAIKPAVDVYGKDLTMLFFCEKHTIKIKKSFADFTEVLAEHKIRMF